MKRSRSFIGCIALSLAMVACQPSADGEGGSSSSSSSSRSSVRPSSVSSVAQTSSVSSAMERSSASSKQTGGSPRIITVTAQNFSFSPGTIKVKKGESVTLVFQGAEGSHGVMIPDLGINVAVPAGETVSVTLPTDKTGTFSFRCSVPCGPGHRDMVGTIIIE